jgi:hypothetical protein
MSAALLTLTHSLATGTGLLVSLLFKRKPVTLTHGRIAMATGFVGFLEKLGKDIGKDTKIALEKVLPDVVKAAQLAEPVIDLALPVAGPIYNTVVNAAVTAVQGYTALGVDATPQQIADAVLTQTAETILPALEKAGLDSATANTVATNYINAILSILNGPLSGASTTSAPAAPAVAASPASTVVAAVAANAAAKTTETSGLAPA